MAEQNGRALGRWGATRAIRETGGSSCAFDREINFLVGRTLLLAASRFRGHNTCRLCPRRLVWHADVSLSICRSVVGAGLHRTSDARDEDLRREIRAHASGTEYGYLKFRQAAIAVESGGPDLWTFAESSQR